MFTHGDDRSSPSSWRGRRKVQAHRAIMINLFIFALVLTGAFTLLPGRVMHAVFFG